MRLFLALDFPAKIQNFLEPLFQEEIPGAKWIPAEQLHLTLRFFGETNEERCLELQKHLQTLALPAFPLCIHGVGVFPSPHRARVLWVGIQAAPELKFLQGHIEKITQSLGFAAETKPFVPHLTLARLHKAAPRQLSRFLEKYQGLNSPPFLIRDFHLYSSLLSPKGAEHRKVATYSLQEAGRP